MKKFLKINAYIISEETENIDLRFNIIDETSTRLNVSSININRKKLSAFRPKLYQIFNDSPDLFIFEIELPHIISKQIIRRINQYIPHNIPAVILAKQIGEPILKINNNTSKILINKPDNVREQKWIKETVSNFWYSIIFNQQ
ncbi:MAG: hypothetical protein HQ541_14480 [Mariniphaga sp.]|nr:hypothetical protein [Mariniphaga sp.]